MDTDTEVICDPGEIWCVGNWIAECTEDGLDWTLLEDCNDQSLLCAAGECTDTTVECAEAINEKSYIGCEYWGVTLANGVDATNFGYAIAVANGGDQLANVNIDDNSINNNNYAVPAGDMIVIDDLPWKTAVKSPGNSTTGWFTRKLPNQGYHLTSDQPVTVYQFSALEYASGSLFSHTNDASLLLPAHVYRDEYVAVSRPSLKVINAYTSETITDPGIFAIVGPAGGPTTVEITTSAYTEPSDSGSNESYPAFSPGETFQTTIQPFEVFQMVAQTEPGCTGQIACSIGYNCCNTPYTYDLTGTRIKVLEGPAPAVFGGTQCSFVPYNKWACDHLEQQMFPLDTWGNKYLCAYHYPQTVGEPAVWRIVSGADDNTIDFNPSSVHPTVVLAQGEYVEFESTTSFEVQSEDRISVTQFMVGQNYTSSTALNGDPAMASAVPVEQYRRDYTFFAPETYVNNYMTVIHEVFEYPTLDGSPIPSGTTYDINGDYAKTDVQISGGIHYIESPEPFAITVYGVGDFTSYMYPGGLDLNKVNIIVE